MKKKILKSLILIWGLQFSASLLGFLINVILVKVLSFDEYNIFVGAFNLVNIFSSIICFGIGGFLLKILMTENKQSYRWFKDLIKVSVTSLLLAFIALTIYLGIMDFESKFIYFTILLSPLMIAQSLIPSVVAFYQYRQKTYSASSMTFLNQAVRIIVLILILLLISNSIIAVGYSFLISGILLLFLFLIVIITSIKNIKNEDTQLNYNSQTDEVNFLKTLSSITPYGLVGIFYVIYYQSGIFILNTMGYKNELGVYNIAFIIIALLYLIPSSVFRLLILPKLHLWSKHDTGKIRLTLKKGTRLMFIISLIIIIPLFFFLEAIIELLFGTNYNKSISIIYILLLTIPFRFMFTVSDSIMMTDSRIKIKLFVQFLTALINVTLNITFISLYGVVGVAYSSFITEVFVFATMYYYTLRSLPKE